MTLVMTPSRSRRGPKVESMKICWPPSISAVVSSRTTSPPAARAMMPRMTFLLPDAGAIQGVSQTGLPSTSSAFNSGRQSGRAVYIDQAHHRAYTGRRSHRGSRDIAQAFFAGGQFLFGLTALGDVADSADDADGFAFSVAQHASVGGNPAIAAVLAAGTNFMLEGLRGSCQSRCGRRSRSSAGGLRGAPGQRTRTGPWAISSWPYPRISLKRGE